MKILILMVSYLRIEGGIDSVKNLSKKKLGILTILLTFAVSGLVIASDDNELFKSTVFPSVSFASQKELLEKAPKDKELIKQGHPFFEKFILREQGFPSELSVNKWPQTEIEVLIGWPVSDKIYQGNQPSRKSANDEKVKKLNVIIAESIKDIGNLKEIKLKQVFSDSLGHEKSIRIIPVDSLYPESSKEKIRGPEGYMLRSAPWYPAINFLGATFFTPGAETGVEGFFLANKNNDIEFAACFVNWNRTDLEVKNAISECLLRSLGIPEALTARHSISFKELKRSQELLYCPFVKSGMAKLEAIKTIEADCGE